MSWSTVGATAQKPRKKPLAKRKPVARPDGMTPLQSEIFDLLLRKTRTSPQSCDEIRVALDVYDTEANMKLIWDALDKNPLFDCCEVIYPGRLYVLRVE